MTNSDESRINRWSRRKTEFREKKTPLKRGPIISFAEDPRDDQVSDITPPPMMMPSGSATETALQTPDTPTADIEPDTALETEDLDALAEDHGLQSLDSLDADSDFKPFMQGGIPEVLKQAAMRRLWQVDKSFGFLDGMNDYDEDFTVIDKIISLLDTNYKVGRGLLSDDDDKTVDEDAMAEGNIRDAIQGDDLPVKRESDAESSDLSEPDKPSNGAVRLQEDEVEGHPKSK